MTWFCYLLRCADDTLYCGITNDLTKRLAAHNDGTGAKYTRNRTPGVLVYQELCEDRSAASKRELAIKKLSRAKKLALLAAAHANSASLLAHGADISRTGLAGTACERI